jgi:cytochrome c peroxidase
MKNFTLIASLFLLSNLSAADIFSDKSQWVRPSSVPYPQNNKLTDEKIRLGKKLFFDPILSRANNIACSSCHDPVKGWSDSDRVAIGDKGRRGTRNSPTILNSAYQHTFFWDGRASSLEEQSLGPIEAHVEMNLNPLEVVKKLKKIPEYQKLFKKAFAKEPISVETLAKAIASFERSIVSGSSRFDKWVAGDNSKLSDEEVEGFQIFLEKGNCSICHSGFNFSDQSFNNVGIDSKDEGRAKVKKRAFWYGTFKTPTLRNIENSQPYFHDGSVEKLEDAVKICAEGGRDKEAKNKSELLMNKHLSEQEIKKITKFLKTLSEPVPDL